MRDGVPMVMSGMLDRKIQTTEEITNSRGNGIQNGKRGAVRQRGRGGEGGGGAGTYSDAMGAIRGTEGGGAAMRGFQGSEDPV